MPTATPKDLPTRRSIPIVRAMPRRCTFNTTQQIGLERILELYFQTIDPTAHNHQGEDHGTRYRTGIYYTTEEDLPTIRTVYDRVASQYDKPLQVEVEPLRCFYPAEAYHQDYLVKHPDGYCHIPWALIEAARGK